jgi:cytochrome c553
MKLKYTTFTFLLIAFSSFTHAEQDTVPVQVTQICASCHGENGNMSITPDTPKIGGQKMDYIVYALKSYQNGKRNHAIMSAMSAALSKSDIINIAKHYSKQSSEIFTKY